MVTALKVASSPLSHLPTGSSQAVHKLLHNALQLLQQCLLPCVSPVTTAQTVPAGRGPATAPFAGHVAAHQHMSND